MVAQLSLPKRCGGEKLSRTQMLEVGSLILRVLCIFIMAVSIWSLVWGGSYYFERLDWPGGVCYVFQREGFNIADISDYDPESRWGLLNWDFPSEPSSDRVPEGDGPCDGLFSSQVDFENFIKESGSFCDRWPDYCAPLSDFRMNILLASTTYVLLIVLKAILFLYQVKGKDWSDKAEYKVTKGLIKASQFWLVSYAPGVVLGPVTSAISHSKLKVVEATGDESHWTITIILSLTVGPYFLCMTVLGSMINCCFRTKDSSTAEDNKKIAKCSRTCGWVLALLFPILGMLLQLTIELYTNDFPPLNFPVVFGFTTPDFGLGFAIDMAQLLQFTAFLLDISVAVARSIPVIQGLLPASMKLAGKNDNDSSDSKDSKGNSESAGDDSLAVAGGEELATKAAEKAAEKEKKDNSKKDDGDEEAGEKRVGA